MSAKITAAAAPASTTVGWRRDQLGASATGWQPSHGGIEPYYGTNPLAFAAPGVADVLSFDMATTVQAWE